MLNHKTLTQSFKHALEGVYFAFRDNQNMKIHFAAALLVIVLGFYFKVRSSEMIILYIMILLVIAAEMINTAIEEMVDLITTEHRQQAKVAKDVAAGMVLVTTSGAFLIGVYIFTPYVIASFC